MSSSTVKRTLEPEDVLRTYPGLCTPSAGLCPSPAPLLLRTFCSPGPLHLPFLLRCVRVSLALHVAATPALRGSLRAAPTLSACPCLPSHPARSILFCFLSVAHLCIKSLLVQSSNRRVFPSRRGAPEMGAIRHSCPFRAGGLSTAATSLVPLSHGPTKETGVGVMAFPVLASAVGYPRAGDSGRHRFRLASGAVCPPFHTAPALLLPQPREVTADPSVAHRCPSAIARAGHSQPP